MLARLIKKKKSHKCPMPEIKGDISTDAAVFKNIIR